MPGSLDRWLQTPPWLDLELDLTAGPMGNPAGGNRRAVGWMQQLTLSAEADLGESWTVRTQLQAFSGDPDLYELIGAAFPLLNTAHPVGLWPSEASVSRRWQNGSLQLKVGLFPLNPEFLTAPVFGCYVYSALNNTLNDVLTGLPISPFAAPGAALRLPTGAGGELRLGTFQLDGQNAIASALGVNPGQPPPRGSLQMLQWSWTDLPGQRRLAGAIQTAAGPVPRQLPAPLLQLGALRADTGLGGAAAGGVAAGEN